MSRGALPTAWPRPARFAVVAYGKLGGLELGYGSDLDLVFLHDSEGEQQQTDGAQPLDNAVFFSRLTRRIISILTMHTTSGKLYEVDIRLRPERAVRPAGLQPDGLRPLSAPGRLDLGAPGPAAQPGRCGRRRGQGRLRAAPRPGAHHLRASGAARRGKWRTCASGCATSCRRARPTLLDVKQDPGGITDIEFLVQYLVLREAYRYPDLVRWSDNIRQLEALAAARHPGSPPTRKSWPTPTAPTASACTT